MNSGHVYTADGQRLYTTAQLAEALGIAPQTVRVRWHRRQIPDPHLYLDGRTPLWTLPKEHHMITTEYGTWANATGAATVEDYVATALGEHGDDFDADAIAADFRDAVDEALPDGVTLAGNLFLGPHDTPAEERPDLREAVESVDFWEIVARHDKS